MGIRPSAFVAMVLGSDRFSEGSRTGTAKGVQAGYRAPPEISSDVSGKNMHSSGKYAFLGCLPTNMILPQGIKAQWLNCIKKKFRSLSLITTRQQFQPGLLLRLDRRVSRRTSFCSRRMSSWPSTSVQNTSTWCTTRKRYRSPQNEAFRKDTCLTTRWGRCLSPRAR